MIKKIGSCLLFAVGSLLVLYGVIIALRNGIIRAIVPLVTVIWIVALLEKNLRTKLMEKKKSVLIISVILFILLLVNSIAQLSSLWRIPTYMITTIWPGYEIILLHCPDVFVLIGVVLVALGAHFLGKCKRIEIKE